VVEVVFAVAVEPIRVPLMDLSAFALGAFGEEFPIRQEQPPMRMVSESFDNPQTVQLHLMLGLLSGQSPVRLWLQSEDQSRLIQLQTDWMACNWQKAGGAGEYPRYGVIEEFFLSAWGKVADFAAEQTGVVPTPLQCELSYINQILPGELWDRPGQLSRVLTLAGDPNGFLPEAEDGQLAFRYRIPHGGRDVGRMYVQAVPAVRPADMTPVIQLNLTARGTPLVEGREGMVAFFRLAHEWIVRGFAAVTTEAAQERMWERRR